MALKHKSAFQPVVDYLMKLCCCSLIKTLCYTEKTIFFSLCVVYLWDEINNHTGIWVCLKSKAWQWHKAAYSPISSECIVQYSMFTAAGKVPFTIWRWLRTMGQIPWAIFCCFPHSGKLVSVLVIFGADCKLWMMNEVFLLAKGTSCTLGLEVTARWFRRCASVHVFGLSCSLCLQIFFQDIDKLYSVNME